MRLSVATNFDNNLPALVAPYGATDLFGKLPKDAVGGGRASYMLAPTSKRRLEEHVRSCRDSGLAFNYLINPACMGNTEFTSAGQKSIRRLLDWLSDIGVEWLTVSIPYLVELTKARYPHFKVKVGAFADVDTPKKAQFFENLGADCITLQPLIVNRDFDRLKAIRQAVKCDLQLILNSTCLLECPMTPYHNVGLSHASQSHSKGFFVDYCLLRCLSMKLSDPANYIKSPWIRPEDVHFYEEIGYSSFKVLERDAPTETLINRVRTYNARRFDGNLLDLVQYYGYKEQRSANQPSRGRFWDLAAFLKPWQIKPLRLLPFQELAKRQGMIYSRTDTDESFYIDNRALDGFLSKFVRESCTNMSCDQCGYCREFADRAVRIDPAYQCESLKLAGKLLDDLKSGELWAQGRKP